MPLDVYIYVSSILDDCNVNRFNGGFLLRNEVRIHVSSCHLLITLNLVWFRYVIQCVECSIIMHDCYELWSVCGILKAELKGEISS